MFRTVTETPVNKAIQEKIAELKPFLQDDDDILETDKITLDDSDETTIIEVAPNVKPKKGNVRKGKQTNATTNDIDLYKDLREKIKRYLNKETMSAKTRKRILKTVDALIAQILGNQCSWKSSDDFEKIAVKMRNHGFGPILKAHNLSKQEWEHFKTQYIELHQDKHIAETLSLFNKFQDLFSRIINDTTTLSKRYKIKCHLVDLNQSEIDTLRKGSNMFREDNHEDECRTFKICSEELKSFMIDFYKAINDTAVSTFRNYAAMYSNDVNSDTSREQNYFIALIYNTSNTVESKISKIFVKETAKIELDKGKDKRENINNLMQYVKNTVGHVKKRLMKNLEKYLKSFKARLLMTVKEDITVNLDVELGNLERDFITRICTAFLLCNARYWRRRENDVKSNPKLQIDGKKVYVKVQLSVNDKLKDDITRNRNLFFTNFDSYKKGIRRVHDRNSAISFSTKINTIQLTRTTRYANDSTSIPNIE